MIHAVKERLEQLSEDQYRQFSSALIPNMTNILGVRLPHLRKLAKDILSDDWRSYLNDANDHYFEETMLQGMIIGLAKTDVKERLKLISDFVPKIDNWSVCDSFCSGLKFTKENKAEVWTFLQPYLSSSKEYEIRFGVVMLLNYYCEEPYITDVLSQLNRIQHPAYYVKMAVAWAISICYVKQPQQTMTLLQHNNLDDFTYNKALQKITESYRVHPEMKDMIRSMKRKSTKR